MTAEIISFRMKKKITVDEAIEAINEIFQDEEDEIDEFINFLRHLPFFSANDNAPISPRDPKPCA